MAQACPHCGTELMEGPLELVIPEASEDTKGQYCILCQKVYWDGILDTTKRKAYGVKVGKV